MTEPTHHHPVTREAYKILRERYPETPASELSEQLVGAAIAHKWEADFGALESCPFCEAQARLDELAEAVS